MSAQFMSVLLCLTGFYAFMRLGLTADALGARRRFELSMGILGFAMLAFKYVWLWNHPNGAEAFVPLHLCNLSELVACLSLVASWYWFRAVLYFWSIGALLVFVTPEPPLESGVVAYFLFWMSHALILYVALYHLVVSGYRPRFRDLVLTIGITISYIAMVVPINIVWKRNFGYVGPADPSVATPIDYLGDWPLRILWITLIGVLAFTFAWLPWALIGLRPALSMDVRPEEKLEHLCEERDDD